MKQILDKIDTLLNRIKNTLLHIYNQNTLADNIQSYLSNSSLA